MKKFSFLVFLTFISFVACTTEEENSLKETNDTNLIYGEEFSLEEDTDDTTGKKFNFRTIKACPDHSSLHELPKESTLRRRCRRSLNSRIIGVCRIPRTNRGRCVAI